MPDEITPDGQQTPPPAGNQTENWEARYKGMLPVVERLTKEKKALEEQLAPRNSEIEQLKAQLIIKDTEKTVSVGERDKTLQEVVQAKTALETELNKLRALKLKIEAINELKRPELLAIADSLPDMTDKEALKTVFGNFANFADDAVKAREKQLLAGITPGTSATPPSDLPTSEQAWLKHADSFPLGSPERAKAMDGYWNFMTKST